MGLRDYLFRQRIGLVSTLPRSEVVRRINAATPSSLVRSRTSRVRGKCFLGRLRLFWDTPNFINGFRPVFSASLREDMGRTLICGRWGALRSTQLWFVVCYGISCAMLLVIVAGLLGYAPWDNNEYAMLPVLPLFSAIPLVAASLSIRHADEQLRAILEFLGQEAQAKPQENSIQG